jgi:hypothetical protein
MCKWGNTDTFEIHCNGKIITVDKCISDLVELLNNNGYGTVASCCGHGKRPGNIALEDGRELMIMRNFKEARNLEKIFPPINEE